MSLRSVGLVRFLPILPLLAVLCSLSILQGRGQSSVNLRVMAANLNGASQTIEPYEIRTFQGLKPDVVCIQEFKYGNNTPAEFRSFVDTAFGTEFQYYREEGSYSIPNGVISRYPILAAGTWDDTQVSDRGFAWARIDLPGTNDLYVVSVHLLTSGATVRATEASALKALIQSNFPAGAWVIVAGDFNADSRAESCVTGFSGLLADYPVPTDSESGGDYDTNNGRNKPYDYVLVSQSMTNRLTNTVTGSRSFPRGLVFDSRVYTPLSDVYPVQFSDSSTAQHMAVIKDFNIPVTQVVAGFPAIVSQPVSRTNALNTQATFSVTASGQAPLVYTWRLNGVVLTSGTAQTYTVQSVQSTDAGAYSVVVSNAIGSVTSSVATLTVLSPAPAITQQPQSISVPAGGSAMFSVAVSGSEPFSYQWRSNAIPVAGATGQAYTITGVQAGYAAGYSVVVTNAYGAVTSAVASLTVPATGEKVVLAGWDTYGLANYGPSPMAPVTNASGVVVGGLARGAGVKVLNSASANSWGGNEFDATTLQAAIDAGDYVTFSIAATGNRRLSFSEVSTLNYRRSSTGPANGILQIQVGNGSFVNVSTNSFSSTTTAALPAIALSQVGLLQNVGPGTNVTFRLILYGGATAGNWYISDLNGSPAPDLAISGSLAVPASPLISSQGTVAGKFVVSVTGTSGADYVVESAPSLLGAWVPVLTNQAPFSVEILPDAPVQFFRARAL